MDILVCLESSLRESITSAVSLQDRLVEVDIHRAVAMLETNCSQAVPAPRSVLVVNDGELYQLTLRCAVAALREMSRFIVVSTNRALDRISHPERIADGRALAILNRLRIEGANVEWVLIEKTDHVGVIIEMLLGSAELPPTPARTATEYSDTANGVTRGLVSAFHLFNDRYHPIDFCPSQHVIDGSGFAASAAELGFRSPLWGPLSETVSATRSGHGVLYFAIGDMFMDIAEFAAESVKQHNPDLQIALVTDRIRPMSFVDIQIPLPRSHWIVDHYFGKTSRMASSKFLAMTLSPFARTLYLDVDTTVRGNIEAVFDTLDESDIVLTNESKVALSAEGHAIDKTVDLTDERSYNAGVFLYRDSPEAERYLTAWWAWYLWDQSGAGRSSGNWGPSGIADQGVLHQMVWGQMHERVGARLSFASNVLYNANDRMWALLHAQGRWDDALIIHSKLPFQVRGTAMAEELWALEWPRRWV